MQQGSDLPQLEEKGEKRFTFDDKEDEPAGLVEREDEDEEGELVNADDAEGEVEEAVTVMRSS